MGVYSLLEERSAQVPERCAFRFLADGEVECASLTYRELADRARALAIRLADLDSAGERVLLLCPPGLDFVASFFACLAAGAVAVPAYPPRSPRTLPRLLSIFGDCLPRVVVAPRSVHTWLDSHMGGHPALQEVRRLAPEEVESGKHVCSWHPVGQRPDDVAFLQYTSGSTSTPKGVMVSHASLLANQALIAKACQHGSEAVFVSWLPLYHDLGLIGNVLQTVFVGGSCVLMAPVAFLQRPRRWLDAVSRYRATVSGGPDFAYELCSRRIHPQDREALDLSCWRTAFNGAEPVRAETLERFVESFGPQGLRRSALFPCYGLAEATLIVSGGPAGGPRHETFGSALEHGEAVPATPGAPGSRRLVSSGPPLGDQRVLVVDPGTGMPCPDGRVGEIWISGASVGLGYWKRPEETAEVFAARLADGAGPFLRTGDLGFFFGGDLFIASRLKDLIILRGRNLYPQDIERTVQASHPALRGGSGAAFSLDDGWCERLAVVHEVEKRSGLGTGEVEEICAAVRFAIAQEHDVALSDLVLIRAGTLPRTSSGKVRRSACREALQGGDLQVIARWNAEGGDKNPEERWEGISPESIWDLGETERRQALASLIGITAAAVARLDPALVPADRPLNSLGLDSLGLVELSHALEARLGVASDPAALFEGATPEDLADRLAGAGGASGSAHHAVAGSPGEQALSWGQETLWFFHRLAPESTAYHIQGAATVRNGCDAAALRRAWQRLLERHEALRFRFAERDGDPFLRIAPPGPAAWTERTVAGTAELRSVLAQETARPFDLEKGPLLRLLLLHRPDGDPVFFLAVHHMVADLWSMGVLLREMAELYQAAAAGREAALPPLPVRYADHAVAERARLAGVDGERLWHWWQDYLRGCPLDLDLPADRPRPAARSFRGGLVSRRAPLQLKALAGERGATPAAVALAGVAALLARLTGREDLLVGVPAAGRGSVALAGLVGYFVNPVAVRTNLADDPRFSQAVVRAGESLRAALAHQDLPFAWLAERLQPDRSSTGAAGLQVALLFQQPTPGAPTGLGALALEVPGAALDLGGLRLQSWPLPRQAAQRDLTFAVAETETGIALSLEFDSDLFDEVTAVRHLGALEALLGAAAADPGTPIACLETLTASELHALCYEWSETPPPRREGEGATADVMSLIAMQARAHPERVAVVDPAGGETTYAGLVERAGRLARFLGARGIAPEVPVGISLERSAGMVEAVLGILAAGGAYVPLDPGLPRERFAWMLADSGTRLLLADRDLPADRVPPGVEVVPLEAALAAGSGGASDWPRVTIEPDHPCYLIYTSGSTGRPKAVVVRHGSLLNFLRGMAARPGLAAEDRLLALTTLSFDIAALEILLPLTVGARVVLGAREEARNGTRLARRLAESGATVLQATPAGWRMLVDAGWKGAPGLKALSGGEALSRNLAERLLETCGEVWNLYGPTETTVWSTAVRVASGRDPVPIGHPLDAVRVRVLDRLHRMVPPGVPGQLWIGGTGLARGYAGRPDLTAATFRPDPFTEAPGERLYATGDLVRWRSDGALEFLGRIDHQVKIRGHRIELGEIEAHLLRHPAVGQAVAGAVSAQGEPTLAAWVVPRSGGAEPTPEELRRFLSATLPEVMLPARFAFVSSLPLSPSGKVDRRGLPEPALTAAGGSGSTPRADDPLETLLGEIWAALLGIERVGPDDDFFAVGGHSLLAMRVLSRVRATLGVDVGLGRLFARPTLAGFAEEVRVEMSASRSLEPLPFLSRRPAGEGSALSFSQERIWFVTQMEPESPAYNVPAAVDLKGLLNPAALDAALAAVVARHEALRTAFPSTDGRAVQLIAPAPASVLAVVDLSALPEAERRGERQRLLTRQARLTFDLTGGLLLRATLVRLAPEEQTLALVLHHIAADGWSLDLLARELSALYSTVCSAGRARAAALPKLPFQYADFAAWQRGWLSAGGGDRLLAQWRQRLAGAPAVLDLPTDRPRPPQPSALGVRLPWRLGAEQTAALRQLARRGAATPFVVLLAGLTTLFHRYTGQDDLVLGTAVACRNRPELEALIGVFINSLPLRADLRGDPAWISLLERMRTELLTALTLQDLPFERLVDEQQPERDLSRTPLFQAMLAYQAAPPAAVVLPGVASRVVPLDPGAAKLDLTLSLQEEETGGVAGYLELRTDLFDLVTGLRLLSHLEVLLAGAAAEPEARLSDLPLISEAELAELVVERNEAGAASASRAGARPVHELFAEHAARRPEAPALQCDEGSLTYGELASAAQRVARLLRGFGVGADVPVGLCTERSPEFVIGVLGILAAGGAVLPIDPEYPAERRLLLVADAGAPVVLTQRHIAPSMAGTALKGVASPVLISLDGDWPEPPEARAGAAPRALPESLAYIIYTSGSTGRPKGVGVEHRHLSVFLGGILARMALPPGAGHAMVSTISADLGHNSLFGALATGGVLHLLSRARSLDPEGVAEHFSRHPVESLKIVPSHLAALMTAARPERVLPRLLVVLGGEPVPWPLAERVRELAPGCRVINEYGPTETTVAVITYETGATRATTPGVPLAHPLPGVAIYLLDRRLRPVPLGVPGEICIAGSTVSRGYVGRPDLTSERFLPDPLGAEAGGRMYRSGDLARFRAGGLLEYLGRIDDQIKVRGFRVEPAEIEVALRSAPAVLEAAVLAWHAGPQDRRLAGYVVLRQGCPWDPEELGSFLRARLPEFMVPQDLVCLPALPITANGKLDRGALPAPARGEGRAAGEMGFVAPRTPAEQLLAGIWRDVLGAEQVGVHDSFFSLGGDSILSIQVAARARRAGLDMAPSLIFRYPTLAGAAAAVESAVPARQGKAPAEDGGPFPLTPIQRWFLAADPADPHHYNQAVTFRLARRLGFPVVLAALARVSGRHEALRLRLRRGAGGWEQAPVPAEEPPATRVDFSALPGGRQAEALAAAEEQIQSGLDLAAGPVHRTLFVDPGDQPGWWVWAIHHMAVDGVSWRVLVEDLEAACTSVEDGEAVLPEPDRSLRCWAGRLRERAGSPALVEELPWWRDRPWDLAVPLPRDRDAGPNDRASERHIVVELGAEETRTLLRELPRAANAGLREALLAAWAGACRNWTGWPVLLVDVEGHGREELFPDLDLSRAVGWFTSLYPVLLDLRRAAEPLDGLLAVKEQLRAVPAGGVGWSLLRWSDAGGALAHLPSPEIVFNYLGRFDRVLPGSSLFAEARELGRVTRSPRGIRRHLLAVNAAVFDERLGITFEYSENLHRRSTLELLAERTLSGLHQLAAAAGRPAAAPPTPSDFPLAGLSQAQLDALLARRRQAS